MDVKYPEIDALIQFFTNNNVSISKETFSELKNITLVNLSLKNNTYVILVQDEYQDFDIQNRLLHLVITLREIEYIEESTDFLNWCKEHFLPAENSFLRDYYQTKIHQIEVIKSYFLDYKLDSFISDLDFQLNSGAAQFLRNTTY